VKAIQPKVVVRFKQWYDPAMAERFAREPDVELRTVSRDEEDDKAWAALAAAHAFQVSSAKLPEPAVRLVQRCRL
jgi:D-3-phosphoglycerate dehydrogenase